MSKWNTDRIIPIFIAVLLFALFGWGIWMGQSSDRPDKTRIREFKGLNTKASDFVGNEAVKRNSFELTQAPTDTIGWDTTGWSKKKVYDYPENPYWGVWTFEWIPDTVPTTTPKKLYWFTDEEYGKMRELVEQQDHN